MIAKKHPYSCLIVRNDGCVYMPSYTTHKARWTFGHKDSDGYLRIFFKGKQYRIHRLVAETFIDNPQKLPTVDHINRIRTDNRVENLRWATRFFTRTTTQPPSRAKEKMMTKFARKKPVTIECMKYNGFNFDEVKKFCGDAAETHPNIERGCYELFIKTLEGNHHASEGDVIIKGVNGEFYPCKPDIFAKTYEFVDAPEAKLTDFVHSFSWALDRLKEGKRIHRSGWNGKGMFAVLQKGYPDGIPCNKQTAEAWGLKEGDLFRCEPYMQLKMVNGSHSMWVPSVNDCLSNDWAIVE